jgi:hypothetical protein
MNENFITTNQKELHTPAIELELKPSAYKSKSHNKKLSKKSTQTCLRLLMAIQQQNYTNTQRKQIPKPSAKPNSSSSKKHHISAAHLDWKPNTQRKKISQLQKKQTNIPRKLLKTDLLGKRQPTEELKK